jgi:hypothetical protein
MKSEAVRLRTTPAERQVLQAAARREGVPVSQLLRRAAIGAALAILRPDDAAGGRPGSQRATARSDAGEVPPAASPT